MSADPSTILDLLDALLGERRLAPAHERPANEPVLCVEEIQGNIVGGFNKDFQTLLFLRIDDPTAFKVFLGAFTNLVATAEEVIAFNRLFKRARDRRGYSGSVKATWINIAFSFAGLEKLTDDASSFADSSFRSGIVAQSPALGDPTAPDAEGNPRQWFVHDGADGADVLIIVASDALADLETEVRLVERLIFGPHQRGRPVRSGASIIFKEEGRNQSGPLAGHEHFGFRDGVSQPGLRGRVSDDPRDVLTPRQNPDSDDQGKPGQDLIWPGEFVFGYRDERTETDPEPKGGFFLDPSGSRIAPAWAKNGSYLVFRRLRQDVFKFHSFLQDNAGQFGLSEAALGAKLVGRWASGAPIMRAPRNDIPALGKDDCANNNFEFQQRTRSTQKPPGREQCEDATFPQSPGDKTGDLCPFAAHVRKAYPRDDIDEEEAQKHRLLRRGIPFGPSSRSTPSVPIDDGIDRGLLFLAYMTSVVEQFEYVTKTCVNDPDFKGPGAGIDPIIGQCEAHHGSRQRTFAIRVDGEEHDLTAPEDWVIPTGGGYFFAPSISALRDVLGNG